MSKNDITNDTLISKAATEAFRDGHERIWGNKCNHELYVTGDKDAPPQILDRNGEVALDCCRKCGKAEYELIES